MSNAVAVLSAALVRSAARFLTESPRAGRDLASLGVAWPLLTAARRGDGHPVLVLPGWLIGDPATLLLRTALRALGHNVSGWGLGTNLGSTGRVVKELRSEVDRLHRVSGRRVSLIGWSLGGMYARELARAAPGSVRGIVTLGSPVVRWSPWLRTASGLADHSMRLPGTGRLSRPWAEGGSLRVPATSVYTRGDGVAPWASCLYEPGPRRENVEVRGSHLGLATNPAVLWLLADRLGMAEGAWAPFRPPPGLSLLFPTGRESRCVPPRRQTLTNPI
jgi:hypothetical protein